MHRTDEDYIFGFNCFALAVFKTGSRALGASLMSDHTHMMIQTDFPKEFIHIYRYAYTRYFNFKYGRTGRLGGNGCFMSSISGIRHITTALNYTLRQGLHHGISPTAFAYKYSTVNTVFQKFLGKEPPTDILSTHSQYRFLPDRAKLPVGCRMSSEGLILFENVIDTRYAEEIYITPKNFIYNMNRLSDSRIVAEQLEEDSKAAPVTLGSIEDWNRELDVNHLIENEHGKVNTSFLTDIQLCSVIDGMLPDKKKSIYSLSVRERSDIANSIWSDHSLNRKNIREAGWFVTKKQLRRCLFI